MIKTVRSYLDRGRLKAILLMVGMILSPLLLSTVLAEQSVVISPEMDRAIVDGPAAQSHAGAPSQLPARQLYDRVNPSCVTIAADNGMGSGFIVSSYGYVLTNWHVVFDPAAFDYAKTITVRMHDGSVHRGRIIKTEPEIDLALIKIDGSGYPFATIGDAHSMAVGDTLYIIGTPHGLTHSMTTGIVSAVNRERGRIQTSAIIHKGNSGGPVFNGRGEVVAVAVAAELSDQQAWLKLKDSEQALPVATLLAGISYLIPINHARNLLELTR
jgi:S1-C subfamily serine protease